ncbi:aspartate/glutamate racemase family protein [Niabella yanshanensis]|uniref:Aspartate/glutamate racemase family protein n=1 Tax=Niabella yanshanensis TaxID=577386 RepID=A0ABZ0WD67_9BACT|nr:aspartate/glutamate racemase family protein [Niabella yanshanensis]WQD40637.1 aspartate/glutamate racemase family protein [Niabella yanshanensis]
MKKLGLVGGISWVSTTDYYRYINEGINAKLGGLNYAECIIYSVNFQEIHNNNLADNWEGTFLILSQACDSLQKAGAEAILLGANTMHLLADRVAQVIDVPLIHVAVATAEAIRAKGLKKVALLGTKFTMERDFFKNKLEEKGIGAIIPDEEGRNYIAQKLEAELYKGIVTEETRAGFLKIIDQLIAQGAEGVILGCTEIPLLIKQEHLTIPGFDTTKIHSDAAVAFALS